MGNKIKAKRKLDKLKKEKYEEEDGCVCMNTE